MKCIITILLLAASTACAEPRLERAPDRTAPDGIGDGYYVTGVVGDTLPLEVFYEARADWIKRHSMPLPFDVTEAADFRARFGVSQEIAEGMAASDRYETVKLKSGGWVGRGYCSHGVKVRNEPSDKPQAYGVDITLVRKENHKQGWMMRLFKSTGRVIQVGTGDMYTVPCAPAMTSARE